MAQLRIQYNRIASVGVEYTLRTTVEPTTTEPNVLDNCLVVKKGDAGTDEEIMRVGDYSEVVTTPKSILPVPVPLFSSPSLPLIPGGIQIGDVIRVYSPFVWAQHFGASALFDTAVINAGVGLNTVSVATPFPAFGRLLQFLVLRGVTVILPVSATPPYPVDGVANRDYTPFGGETEFLTDDQASTWTDIDVANGRYTALQINAQSLVDVVKEDNYTGQADRIYS